MALTKADSAIPASRTTTGGTGNAAPRNAAATRRRILAAATAEFALKGFQGARIDAIAERAGANKSLIYLYFDNKDGLFVAVLEKVYADIRSAEQKLKLTSCDPVEGMRQLVVFSFDYVARHPEFVAIINDENMLQGIHVRNSKRARELNSPLVATIRELLERGSRQGSFRSDVDPVQLYITIAAACYFHVANRHTLSAIFDLDQSAVTGSARLDHVVALVLGYLRP
jgi:TetR/AcrR family transcriptional regulator